MEKIVPIQIEYLDGSTHEADAVVEYTELVEHGSVSNEITFIYLPDEAANLSQDYKNELKKQAAENFYTKGGT